ncbi:MAG: hypothetical protein QM731_06695 [Chitinophagaceae bacterium]
MLQYFLNIACMYLIVFPGINNASAQLPVKNDFDFDDLYGNTITLKNPGQLPSPLDTAFIRLNITGASFRNVSDTSERFHFRIEEIRTVKKSKQFEFRVFIYPKTTNVEKILKYQGYRHYLVKVSKLGRELKLDSIAFLFFEI